MLLPAVEGGCWLHLFLSGMSVKSGYTISLPLQLQALATATPGQELVVHRTVLYVQYGVKSYSLSRLLGCLHSELRPF
jgi:hypothetical protein